MPEVRLIDVNALLKECENKGNFYSRIVREFLLTAPTVDAEPVRHGRWIDAHFVSGVDFNRCSECGCYIEKTFFANDYNVRYCPACGVKMDLRTPTEAQLDEADSVMMGGADNG